MYVICVCVCVWSRVSGVGKDEIRKRTNRLLPKEMNGGYSVCLHYGCIVHVYCEPSRRGQRWTEEVALDFWPSFRGSQNGATFREFF